MSDDWKKEAKTEPVEVPGFLRHPLKPQGDPDIAGELSTPLSGAAIEEHAGHAPPQPRSDQAGLYLYGIVRARAGRIITRSQRDIQRVRYRDIEALVRQTTFELPPNEPASIKAHQEVVETMMRRITILPVPYGLVFKGRRALVHLLQDQYLVLDEGLSLLDGHWELRLHINAEQPGQLSGVLSDQAMAIYAELRRYARAAVTLASDGDRVLGAAFLVDRTSWVDFIERIEDYGKNHKGLTFDVTGPWPAYDFVRLVT